LRLLQPGEQGFCINFLQEQEATNLILTAAIQTPEIRISRSEITGKYEVRIVVKHAQA
jgi:hypothetical protein